MQRGAVDQGVHGVEAQSIDMEHLEPAQRRTQDELADLVGVGFVQVHRLSPRGGTFGEIRAVVGKVVARRAEMVVHRVDDHAEPPQVAGIDEPREGVGTSVGLLHRVPADAVVAPVVGAVEGVDRHQLDKIHADVHQVVQFGDRRIEGAVGSERADVQFIDDCACDGPALPVRIRPDVWVDLVHLGQSVDAIGLSR